MCYHKLVQDVENNTSTAAGSAFSPPYDNLVDNFVHPVLRWAVFIEYIYGSYLSVQENGIVQRTQSPSTVAAEKAEVEGKVEMAESRLERALERLRQHLDASGASIYTELRQSATLRIDERTNDDGNFGPGFYPTYKKITNRDSGSYYDDNTEY